MTHKSTRLDRELAERLNNLAAQNETLAKARGAYLLKEAERKNYEAKLISIAEGKSHAERQANAYATDAWLQFNRELAELENEFEFQKLRYDILDKAFLAEYASYKLDNETMKRSAG